MDTINIHSHGNSEIYATEEDIFIYFVEKRENLLDILETNNVFYFNKQSQILVIYIQNSTTVRKQTLVEILPPSSGNAVLMLAVVHVIVNMDDKGYQCEYDISVISPILGDILFKTGYF